MIQVFAPTRLPPVDMREVLRYAGDRGQEPSTDRIQALIPEALEHIRGQVCFDIFPLGEVTPEAVDLGFTVVSSRSLSSLLADSAFAVVFGATLGLAYDRFTARTSRLSPADAWFLHALGTERIEALCDQFEEELRRQGHVLTRRFSPGYGDVPLALQKDLFRVLDCSRKIGLTLNASLLMSPSKSVTALMGVLDKGALDLHGAERGGCQSCSKTDCAFREENRKNR